MSFKCQARDLEAFWQIGMHETNLCQVSSYINKYSFCFVGGGVLQVLRQRVLFVEVRSISIAKIAGSSVSGILF